MQLRNRPEKNQHVDLPEPSLSFPLLHTLGFFGILGTCSDFRATDQWHFILLVISVLASVGITWLIFRRTIRRMMAVYGCWQKGLTAFMAHYFFFVVLLQYVFWTMLIPRQYTKVFGEEKIYELSMQIKTRQGRGSSSVLYLYHPQLARYTFIPRVSEQQVSRLTRRRPVMFDVWVWESNVGFLYTGFTAKPEQPVDGFVIKSSVKIY